VATRTWDFLEKPLTLDELCLTLMDEYEVGEDQCRSEVTELLTEMMKLGLILEDD
jgi:hypothetical protein